jgi:hypothetical protein
LKQLIIERTPKKSRKKYKVTLMFSGVVNLSNLYINEEGYCIFTGERDKKYWQILLLQMSGEGYNMSEIISEIKKLKIGPKNTQSISNFFYRIKRAVPKLRFEPILNRGKITVACLKCGKIRTIQKSAYRDLCKKCAAMERAADPEWREKHANAIRNPEHAKKISAGLQGIAYEEWEGFASEKRYCPKFNELCRESNREKYDRRCFLSNLPESENITNIGKQKKLSVHHTDMDKGQGCNGARWRLVPLCMEYHGSAHSEPWKSRIVWLLENVWDNDVYIWFHIVHQNHKKCIWRFRVRFPRCTLPNRLQLNGGEK